MTQRDRDRLVQMGLKIAYYRKRRGLTQEQLAELIHKNPSYIGQVEAPQIVQAISLQTLFEIADALSVPPYKLLHFD